MNRNLLIFGGIGAALIVAIVLTMLFMGRDSSDMTPSDPFPFPSGNGDTGTNETVSIPASDGGTIRINDPLDDPGTAKDPENAGFYYMGYHTPLGAGDSTGTEHPPYVIEYIADTGYFNVGLYQEPIGEVRRAAEEYLMQHLDISKEDMCRLTYMVSVPHWVNEYYSSRNLGFSFCRGAVELPE